MVGSRICIAWLCSAVKRPSVLRYNLLVCSLEGLDSLIVPMLCAEFLHYLCFCTWVEVSPFGVYMCWFSLLEFKHGGSFIVSYRAEMVDVCFSTQLIDGDGVFNVSGLEDLMKQVRLGECGLSYAVVSIMGPQSSGMDFLLSSLFSYCFLIIVFLSYQLLSPNAAGKSTLLNNLFGTNFREMDAFRGRYTANPQHFNPFHA
jgi:hypothetical protein